MARTGRYESTSTTIGAPNTFNDDASESPKPSHPRSLRRPSAGGPLTSKNILGGPMVLLRQLREAFADPVPRPTPHSPVRQSDKSPHTPISAPPVTSVRSRFTYTVPSTSVLATGQSFLPGLSPLDRRNPPKDLTSSPPVQRAFSRRHARIRRLHLRRSQQCDGLDACLAFRTNMAVPSTTISASPASTTTSARGGISTVRSVTTKWSGLPANQVDIGGLLSRRTSFGTPTAVSNRRRNRGISRPV